MTRVMRYFGFEWMLHQESHTMNYGLLYFKVPDECYNSWIKFCKDRTDATWMGHPKVRDESPARIHKKIRNLIDEFFK